MVDRYDLESEEDSRLTFNWRAFIPKSQINMHLRNLMVSIQWVIKLELIMSTSGSLIGSDMALEYFLVHLLIQFIIIIEDTSGLCAILKCVLELIKFCSHN